MKKLVFLLFLLTFVGINSLSAQYKVYGKVKTATDERFHGEVITYVPEKTVTMDCQGDTLSFDLTVDEFEFTTRKPARRYVFPDGQTYNRLTGGVLVGRRQADEFTSDGGYLSYSYHKQKSRLIGYGGKLSFENYGDAKGYDFIAPGVVFYSYFLPSNATPFFRAHAGYGIAIKNSKKFQTKATGGVNLGASLGYRLSTNKIMIDLAVGGRFQKGNYVFEYIDRTAISDIFFKRLDISVGFMW